MYLTHADNIKIFYDDVCYVKLEEDRLLTEKLANKAHMTTYSS